ncbi:MAG: sulfite exporter TauE/SafE family protein [Dehalococcoidia bacterium]
MDLANLSLAAAFVVGLAHTLEPCEDKAIVSLFVFWAAKKLSQAIGLVVLYGLGMALADTAMGFVLSYVGVRWLDIVRTPLEITAGAITIIFGFFMLRGKELTHVGHHHGEAVAPANSKLLHWYSILGFGIVRGLPPCPLEFAMLLWAASLGDVRRGTATIFVFGLGTTVGLIPLGLIMGGISNAISRTRYESLVPKITAILMMCFGLFLMLAPIFGIEL